RKMLMITQSAMMVFAFVMCALAYLNIINVEEIALLAAGTGIAMALNTPTYQALVPQLVPRKDLTNAIALNSAQFNMSRVLGPSLPCLCSLLRARCPAFRRARAGHPDGLLRDWRIFRGGHRGFPGPHAPPRRLHLPGQPGLLCRHYRLHFLAVISPFRLAAHDCRILHDPDGSHAQ